MVARGAWQEQPRQDPMERSAGARASESSALGSPHLASRPAVDSVTSTLLGSLNLKA